MYFTIRCDLYFTTRTHTHARGRIVKYSVPYIALRPVGSDNELVVQRKGKEQESERARERESERAREQESEKARERESWKSKI